MSAAPAQCCIARRAAPTTSLPALMFGGGELRDVEKAMMIGLATHRRATMPAASVYCRDAARIGVPATMNVAIAVLRLTPSGGTRPGMMTPQPPRWRHFAVSNSIWTPIISHD